MAEEKDPGFQRSSANLHITTDSPEGVTPEAETKLLDELASFGEPFSGTYEEAVAQIVARALTPSKPGAQVSTGRLEDQLTLKDTEEVQPTAEQQILQQTAQEAEDEGKPKWWEHIIGGIAAITRGATPATAGALVGSPFGPLGMAIGAIAMALGEPVTWALEKVTGRDFTSPAEGLSNLLTEIGVPESETAAAELLEGATRLGTTLVTGILPAAGAVAQTIGAGSSPLAAPGITQSMLQTASQVAPVPVIAGEIAEEFAGVGGRRLAEAGTEALGIENPIIAETIQSLVGMATSILGGGLVEGGLEFAGRVGRDTAQSGFRARDPEDTGRAPLTRSEINKRNLMSTKRGADVQAVTDEMMGGTGEIRRNTFWRNQQELKGFLGDYGVEVDDLGGIPDFGPELLDNFLSARRVELTKYVELRDSVRAQMPTDGVVPVPTAVEYLDVEIARLAKRTDDAGVQLHRKAIGWRESISEKDFGTLHDTNRAIRSELGTTANETIRGEGKQIVDEMYRRVASDMNDYVGRVGNEDLLGQWRTANDNLSALAGDLDTAALKGIINQANLNPDNMTSGIVLTRLNSMEPSDVQQVYRSMDEEGQRVMRQAFVAELARSQDFNQLSPNQFSQNVAERAQAAGIVFTPNERQTIAGMKKHFDITRRAEEVSTGRATGPRGLPISAMPGGGTMLSAGVRANMAVGASVGIVGLFGIGKLSRVVESFPHIGQLFRELADLSPGSESAVRLSRIIGQALNQVVEREERREEAARHIASSPRIQELFPGLEEPRPPVAIPPPIPREE